MRVRTYIGRYGVEKGLKDTMYMIKSIIGYSFAFAHNSDIRTPSVHSSFRKLSSIVVGINKHKR